MTAVTAAVRAVLTLGLVVAAWRASDTPVAAKASPPRLSKKSLLGGGNGGFDNHGDLWEQVSNLTPYTGTLVTQNCGGSGLLGGVDPPAAVKPGQDYVYAARCDQYAVGSDEKSWIALDVRHQVRAGAYTLTLTTSHLTTILPVRID